MPTKIKLGSEVEDKVSGFTGIAVARIMYLNGCARISVQPKIDKEGKLPISEYFDEPQLTVVTSKVVSKGSKDTGGPNRYIPLKRKEEI